MYIITELNKTCDACPAQWEGRTSDGFPIYIRYRWGHLSICIGPNKDGDYDEAVMGQEIFACDSGDGFDGFLSFKELKKLTKGKIKFKAKTKDSLWYRSLSIPERLQLVFTLIKSRLEKFNDE